MELNEATAARLRQMVGDPQLETNFGLEMTLRLLAKWRSQMIADALLKKNPRVLGGPFAGMRYFNAHTEGSLAARLLGSYESELHPYIEKFSSEFIRVIDIGCAEGYYAVGLALRNLNANVYAYDISPVAQAACKELARLNNVSDKVRVGGEFNPADLENFASPRTLRDPVRYPAISEVGALIIECHEDRKPGVHERLTRAFEQSHEVLLVRHALSAPQLPEWLEGLSHLDQLIATEWRQRPTPWLVMTKRV